jgi:hypothetical protein
MSTETELKEPSVGTPLPTRAVLRRGIVALLVGVLAVGVTRAIAGLIVTVPPGFGPAQWGATLGVTAFAAVIATLVYAVLDRFTARPDRNFLVVAVAVSLLMLVPVATVAPSIPGATTGLLGVLVALHVVAAVGISVPLVRGRAPDAAPVR